MSELNVSEYYNKYILIYTVSGVATDHLDTDLTLTMGKFSRRQIDIFFFLFFLRHWALTFHANCPPRRHLHGMSKSVFW